MTEAVGAAEIRPADQRLIAAAVELLRARGPGEVSSVDVAEAANVDPSLVNHYFGTSDRFFALAIVELGGQAWWPWLDLFEAVQRTSATTDDFEAGVAGADHNIDLTRERHVAAHFVAALVGARSDPVIARFVGDGVASVASRIEKLTASGNERGWTAVDLPSEAYAYFQIATTLCLLLEGSGDQGAAFLDHLRFSFALRRSSASPLREVPRPESVPLRPPAPEQPTYRSPRQVDREDRQRALLKEASSLVGVLGGQGLRMRDLSDTTSESVATMYRWFGSKRGLLEAIGRWRLGEMRAAVIALLADEAGDLVDDEARLDAFASLRWDFLTLLSLHQLGSGFDLFASDDYLEMRSLATQLIGPPDLDRINYLVEMLWMAEVLAEVAEVDVAPRSQLHVVEMIRRLFVAHEADWPPR